MTTAADDSAVEDAFEALLAGRPAPRGAAGLAAFTEAVRDSATSPGRPNAALAELLATGLLVDQSSPSARTARSAGAPPSRASRNRIRRRFAVFFPALLAKLLSAGAVAQAATGATVVVVAFAGAGAVGVLPGPVQDTFTSIVSDETEELPVEEVPVEEAPVAEESVEEVPVGEEPVAEAPVVEEPVADAAGGRRSPWTAEREWAHNGPDRRVTRSAQRRRLRRRIAGLGRRRPGQLLGAPPQGRAGTAASVAEWASPEDSSRTAPSTTGRPDDRRRTEDGDGRGNGRGDGNGRGNGTTATATAAAAATATATATTPAATAATDAPIGGAAVR